MIFGQEPEVFTKQTSLAQVSVAFVTLVIPRTPIFGLEEVEPFPVPKSPAMMQQTPSVKIPLKSTKHHQTPVPAVCQVRHRFPSVPVLPVDGVHRRGGGSRQTGAGVIIADGLDDARHDGAQHSQHPG